METYHGMVRSPMDAIILFEACRQGLLPRVQRRLSEKERQSIKSGSIFVWDEREAGMRRWTDGKSWSASRVSGSFLCYREMEGKRGGGSAFPSIPTASQNGKSPDHASDSDSDNRDGLTEGYRYKPDGLMKQSFSITTSTNQKLHLISYYARSQNMSELKQPSMDPQLKHIIPQPGVYPEQTLSDPPPPQQMHQPMPMPYPPRRQISPPAMPTSRRPCPSRSPVRLPPASPSQRDPTTKSGVSNFHHSPLPLLPPESSRYSSPSSGGSGFPSRTPPRPADPWETPVGMEAGAASLDVQDIPNEKLGFGEDARALRQLDKASFANFSIR
ncbi:hypothetical protein DRE_02864 [Drechslerella stenobrocha 248]|uniref:cAMP-independent regulatory protein pac2 n=1 Tax=Drechslerella stenobrocha 248 TaxID=1043628 RepID=W7I7B2_9PEZI|nr:hypothetical protein DRE_02864 [Drechslerella stenobrocha 248]